MYTDRTLTAHNSFANHSEIDVRWRLESPQILTVKKIFEIPGVHTVHVEPDTWRPDAEVEGTLEEDRVANIVQWSPDGWER